ncbi:hypothetical protein BSK56_26715 [Paenibacillus borealis]|uniref:Uncharacterized protein n=1 Tax=Paenibacillus borealis TaxID=160799 RepID=A0ABX3H2I5_PAEBO|nr:DUF6033 family protein [Paenibacillus borealis]OMD41578.1 hypothetical protein BSK56_26715 [Paenibacillus borealis]
MNISISRVQRSSIKRPPQSKIRDTAAAPSLGFSETLASVTAMTEEQAQKIRDIYDFTVSIETIPADDKDITKRGTSGSLQEVVVAPNILHLMSKDPSIKKRVYGYIDSYIHEDLKSLAQMEELHGVTVTGHSLIIHKDGTYTVWSASVASPGEVEKGRRIEADKLKEKAEQAHIAAVARNETELVMAEGCGKQPVTQPGEPALPAAIRALSSRDLLKLSLLIRNSKSDKRQ